MKSILTSLCFVFIGIATAQTNPDSIYSSSIHTVKLFQQNNQHSLPMIELNSADLLELHFDDFDSYIKTYYYTVELCNADWQPADLSPFDYIKGFTQNRIIEARPSSIAKTKYIHYQLTFPERNCMPSKSGNYLLKVFLNGDATQLVFTRRMFVYQKTIGIGAMVQQPYSNDLIRSHQKLQVNLNTTTLNLYSPLQQLQVYVLQNFRWDNMIKLSSPSFIRGNVLEYNGEESVFPGGKEYRWADLRSFRFQSDRVGKVLELNGNTEIMIKPDISYSKLQYLYRPDYNGWYNIESTESINNWWQSDYATVHFTFVPYNNQPFPGKNVYLMGELTGNNINSNSLMEYNATKGVYEKDLLLKQGYYTYTYITSENGKGNNRIDSDLTEGNYWETENDYTVLVYYRSISGRHDELAGVTIVNTKMGIQ